MKRLLILLLCLGLAGACFLLPWAQVQVTGIPVFRFTGLDNMDKYWHSDWNLQGPTGPGNERLPVPQGMPGRMWSMAALGCLGAAALAGLLGAVVGRRIDRARRVAALAAVAALWLLYRDWVKTLDFTAALEDFGVSATEVRMDWPGLVDIVFTPWFWAGTGLAGLAALLPGRRPKGH